MINTRFESYKVKRAIKQSGRSYHFDRPAANECGEPIRDSLTSMGNLSGLYHEQNSNIQVTTGDTTQSRTKKIPMILCLYDDFEKLKLKTGDITSIGKYCYKITGVVNIQGWNVIADISLEVIDNGFYSEV